MDMSVWFLVGAIFGFLHAVRVCHGGNRVCPREKRRKHHHEEPDGLLHPGTVVFIFAGYGLMMGEHGSLGLIGKPEWGMFRDFDGFDWSSFLFQLVFCATAATGSTARPQRT